MSPLGRWSGNCKGWFIRLTSAETCAWMPKKWVAIGDIAKSAGIVMVIGLVKL
jgi:hypothetical protein